MALLWILVALAALAGGAIVFVGVSAARGAPQEAAAAAIGIALAVIPYVFARAIGGIAALNKRQVRDAVLEALRESQKEERVETLNQQQVRDAMLEALRMSRDETLQKLKSPT
jgi:hypothetical protein